MMRLRDGKKVTFDGRGGRVKMKEGGKLGHRAGFDVRGLG